MRWCLQLHKPGSSKNQCKIQVRATPKGPSAWPKSGIWKKQRFLLGLANFRYTNYILSTNLIHIKYRIYKLYKGAGRKTK